MKPHKSPRIRKNQFVAIRVIRGLCGIGVLFVIDSCRISSYVIVHHMKFGTVSRRLRPKPAEK